MVRPLALPYGAGDESSDCNPPVGNCKRRHLAAKGPYGLLLFAQFHPITQSVDGVPAATRRDATAPATSPSISGGGFERGAMIRPEQNQCSQNFWRRLCSAKLSSGR